MRSGSRCPAFYGEIPPMRWGILNDDGGYFYCITYKRKALYAEYWTAQQDMRELTAAKGNLDHLYRATEGRGHKAQER